MAITSLYTALSGIRAAQVGLDTTSNNVSNANTTGYTRQRVELRERSPWGSPVGPIGQGVKVEDITRVRDGFLDRRARGASASATGAETKAQLLGRLELVMGEPDLGISAELGALWDSFEDFASAPADIAVREQVVAALGAVTNRIGAIAADTEFLETDTTARLVGTVDEAESLLTRIETLNREIPLGIQRGVAPNDLLDERDRLIDRLAELTGVGVTPEQDGRVTLVIGGRVALDGKSSPQAPHATLATDGDTISLGGQPVTVQGEAGALSEFLTVGLPQQRARLDAFTQSLVRAVNETNEAGRDANGADGQALLTFNAGSPSTSVAVLDTVRTNPALLAAAGADGPFGVHDGRNAQALADLRSRAVVVVGSNPERTESLDNQFRAVVVQLAYNVRDAQRAADSTGGLEMAAAAARASVHGVSLDEEMVALVQYQRALEAASRVMTAVDEVLDVLVNRTGVVGR